MIGVRPPESDSGYNPPVTFVVRPFSSFTNGGFTAAREAV
jgi:hypothetical protein